MYKNLECHSTAPEGSMPQAEDLHHARIGVVQIVCNGFKCSHEGLMPWFGNHSHLLSMR